MNEDTQPLTAPVESFQMYLQRHDLTIIEAARLAQVPSSFVWRVTRKLPVSTHKARIMLDRLTAKVGTRYKGSVVIIQRDEKIRTYSL